MDSKFYILILLFILSFGACQSQDNFKYIGAYPEGKFYINKATEKEIIRIDGDSIPLRDRIYIEIDSLGSIFINGHKSSIDHFKTDLAYVLTNPDQLTHLPENLGDVVLFLHPYLSLLQKDRNRFQIQYVSNALNDFYIEQRRQYISSVLKKEVDALNSEDHQLLAERFNPSIALAEIEDDKGINVKIPPWAEGESEASTSVNTRNILKVLVDEEGRAIINEVVIPLNQITDLVKTFIMNPEQLPQYAESSTAAIISLKNKRSTPYQDYLAVYNAIKGAYNELWDEAAQKQFQQDYKDLDRGQKKTIRSKIPLVISEAEPTGF